MKHQGHISSRFHNLSERPVQQQSGKYQKFLPRCQDLAELLKMSKHPPVADEQGYMAGI
jgi:hypothetical protein